MRAPGHPQASFGLESIIDEMALALNMDPLELRIKNDPSEVRREQFRIAGERFGWKARYRSPGSSSGPVKSGVGCGGATWGGGGRGTEAEVQINPDGTVEVRCGTQDLGTGTKTLIAIVAAEVFGIEPSAITVKIGDTAFPTSGGSGGSTTAASVSPAVFDACQNALRGSEFCLRIGGSGADRIGIPQRRACELTLWSLAVAGEKAFRVAVWVESRWPRWRSTSKPELCE